MKRIVYGILVMIGCASCDPEIYMDGGHESEWFIKNTTDTPFSVSPHAVKANADKQNTATIAKTVTVIFFISLLR